MINIFPVSYTHLDVYKRQVNIITKGGFYDTATVGFGSAGESNSAIASAQIYNGGISDIVVDETGDDYQAIPTVTILAKSLITPTNPIQYSLTSGSIPAGCNFLSNGLIVGCLLYTSIMIGKKSVIIGVKAKGYTSKENGCSFAPIQIYMFLMMKYGLKVGKSFNAKCSRSWNHDTRTKSKTRLSRSDASSLLGKVTNKMGLVY